MAGYRIAAVRGQPNCLRFGDQIADGQHQALVADDDAITAALSTQNIGGERLFGNFGAQQHHRRQCLVQVKVDRLWIRLHGLRKSPVFGVAHGRLRA